MVTRRALLSVTDKTGIVEFAKGLHAAGFSVLSTGGTFRLLQENGVPAVEVSSYTGFPEIMDGRVKTLHPKVHGGVLARRDETGDLESMEIHGIDPIDVVAVNLYRFREAANRPGAQHAEVLENIDIGGPTMIRAAAKNHANVTVVVDPSDYTEVLGAFEGNQGAMDPALGQRLAAKAFAHTAAYDTAIAQWFGSEGDEPGAFFGVTGERVAALRYGENPHQRAALYVGDDRGPGLASAEQLNGKELSYNNLLDLDAALGVVLEFADPAVSIIKHNNPCGTAVSDRLDEAFVAALASDELSAFGGIVAMNRPLDLATAEAMLERGTFVEAVVAPEVEPAALDVLRQAKWGKNVRVLSLGGLPEVAAVPTARPISGGMLVQDRDAPAATPDSKTATSRSPSADERAAMEFAWRVVKHVKSNAIVLVAGAGKTFATIGVGAGQMSRVDSVEIAIKKAGSRVQGAVLASDAFFPFADGVEAAAKAGVTAVIQPGGSKRDDEVVQMADANGMAMVFTGMRHFRH